MQFIGGLSIQDFVSHEPSPKAIYIRNFFKTRDLIYHHLQWRNFLGNEAGHFAFAGIGQKWSFDERGCKKLFSC